MYQIYVKSKDFAGMTVLKRHRAVEEVCLLLVRNLIFLDSKTGNQVDARSHYCCRRIELLAVFTCR